jgi:uracil-DNA glycosylase family 4
VARDSLGRLDRDTFDCRLCPRLVRWREEVGCTKRRAFRGEEYWARPVPGFGDPRARVLVLGLAPGAHGANRTGRPFTGDGSGPFLFDALHRTGFATGSVPVSRADGIELAGLRITNAVRCVPPGNRPTRAEAAACSPYLEREVRLLPELRVVLCLGAIAWDAGLRLLRGMGAEIPRPRPRFGHGAELAAGNGLPVLLGSFHPSLQNTNTGRLTPAMLRRALARARELAGR